MKILTLRGGWVFAALLFCPCERVLAQGVIEINQVSADEGGITAGDTAGLPVTISEPGSYILTGNLTVPDENTHGIEITVSNVTIDLNGFSISGSTVCTGSPAVTSCSPTGSGVGVMANFAGSFGVSNGAITGMGSSAILGAGSDGVVKNIYAENNGAAAIGLSRGQIVDCRIIRNAGVGISGGSSVIARNQVRFSESAGITSAQGRVVDNVVLSNGGPGIFVQTSGVISGNVCRFNGGFGLELLSPSVGYLNNSLVLNTAGTVSGGTALGANICETNTTCP